MQDSVTHKISPSLFGGGNMGISLCYMLIWSLSKPVSQSGVYGGLFLMELFSPFSSLGWLSGWCFPVLFFWVGLDSGKESFYQSGARALLVLLLVCSVCFIAAALCPSHGPAWEGGDGTGVGWGGAGESVHPNARTAVSVSMHYKVSQARGMRSFSGKLEFVKASTHGKSVSMLSLVTVIVFVVWSQKKFKSWDIVVRCLCIYLPLLFELFQAAVPVQRSL